MRITSPKVARPAIAIALVLGFFFIVFVSLNVVLVAWTVWRYPHHNSMVEPWAAVVSLAPALIAAIVIAIPVSKRLTVGMQERTKG